VHAGRRWRQPWGLLFAIPRSNPHLHGILFDLPHVSAGADDRIPANDLQARCRAAAGDMFLDVPRRGDAYLLSRVIHDWDDERAIAILESCRRSMGSDSRLLLVEEIITAAPNPIRNVRSVMF
jgi:hypothetical protein